MNKLLSENTIVAATSIAELLEIYPEMEKTLLELTPSFQELQDLSNRKSIAKITNLDQVAIIAGMETSDLISLLSTRLGQASNNVSQLHPSPAVQDTPDWMQQKAVLLTIDIRIMLHYGEQPVNVVIASLKKMKQNGILKIIASSVPVALIGKIISIDLKFWIEKKEDHEFWVYFSE